MAKRKLQTELSLQQKSEILLRIEKVESQRKLAEQYFVSKTKTANIQKNVHSFINSVESSCSQNRKRKMRKTENEEVNNIMLEFFIKCRVQNFLVTGPILRAKAAEIASGNRMELGYSQHSKEETDNITSIFYHSKMRQKSVVHVDQWLCK